MPVDPPSVREPIGRIPTASSGNADSERIQEEWARELWERGEANGQFGEPVRFCNGLLLQAINQGATHVRLSAAAIELRVGAQWRPAAVGRELDGRCSPRQALWRLKQMSELPVGSPAGEAQAGKLVLRSHPAAAPATLQWSLFFVTHAPTASGSSLLLERHPAQEDYAPWPAGLGELIQVGTRLGEDGRSAEAQRSFERALALLERHPDCDPSAWPVVLQRLGGVLEDRRLDAEAEAVLRRLERWSQSIGSESEARASALTTLGAFGLERGKLDEAAEHLTQAQAIGTALWGEDAPLWPARERARLTLARGQVERSRDSATETLSRARARGLTALMCHLERDLGLLEQAASRPEAAATHLERALQLAGALGRPLPLLSATLQRELARSRREQGRVAEAQELLRSCRDTLRARRGPDDRELQEVAAELGALERASAR